MSEVMYGLNSLLICALLLAAMVAAIAIGYRLGRNNEASASKAIRDSVNSLQTSLLGVLALLLAFSFSLALQRYDNRNAAVVDEANAIGTVFLRTQLLPNQVRGDVRKLLQSYVDLRVQESAVSLEKQATRQEFHAQAIQLQDALWNWARRAAEENPNPVTTGLFIQSLDETIDAYGRRDAALDRHVPEVILFLLFGTIVAISGGLGYTSGLGGHRPALVSYLLVALIVVITFIIIDLDRPRRGLINVDQSSLIELKDSIDQALSAEPSPP